ncbi:MAG: hypothetical protein JWM11_2265 [Planctomycetaceae bacterium]|nr:hypothetical protein [Planctomycetaceae bacterium]
MHALMIVCEYVAGIFLAIINFFLLLLGLLVGLAELPRYLRIRNM